MKSIPHILIAVAMILAIPSLIANPIISQADYIKMDLLAAPHIGSVAISENSSDKPIVVTRGFVISKSLLSPQSRSWLDAPGRDYRQMRSDKSSIAD